MQTELARYACAHDVMAQNLKNFPHGSGFIAKLLKARHGFVTLRERMKVKSLHPLIALGIRNKLMLTISR